MAYSTNGNLALQPKKKTSNQPEYRESKRVVVKKSAIPTKEKLLWMCTVAFCVVVAGIIIFRYAQIYNTNLEIKQMKSEYEAISIDIKEKQKQVETLSDPERIRNLAESQGMASTMESGITINPEQSETQSAMNDR